MDHNNRRNYFRVEILIPVKWQVLNNSETALVKNGSSCLFIPQTCLKNSIDDMGEKISSPAEDEHIYNYFQLVNNKLDFILNMMPFESENISPRDNIIEISGSGLKFHTTSNIDKNVLIKMNLFIQAAPAFQMEIIVQTMRIEKHDSGYTVAANIMYIDDEARDFIIKMIFQKQRNDIRRLKAEKEVNNEYGHSN
jgi:hypothetical protein